MAKEKKFVEAITSRDEDFAQWYTDVVSKAALCDYTDVKGCMVYLCFCANVRKKKKILSYSSYLCAQRNNNWITWINLLLFGCLSADVNI